MLTRLTIERFRNLHLALTGFSSGFNLIYGENGAGKTSLLEAIYYLGLGRSFRTHINDRIIHHDADDFCLFAQLTSLVDQKPTQIGIQRCRTGQRVIRLNGEDLSSPASLVRHLPIQLLTPHSYRYFTDGPKLRRQYLDWGVFHVEHSFYQHWQQLQRLLKQRNAALKQRYPQREIALWDEPFITVAMQIDQQRAAYVHELAAIFGEIQAKMLDFAGLRLSYARGWSKERDLSELLETGLERDYQQGYTQHGPHRADLRVLYRGAPIGDVLSQGQQKMVAYALYLSQGILFQQHRGIGPIYLIDDLPSELDNRRQQLVAEQLSQLDSQVFITGIDQHAVAALGHVADNPWMFHVEPNARIATQ